jgi:hypothetical protein
VHDHGLELIDFRRDGASDRALEGVRVAKRQLRIGLDMDDARCDKPTRRTAGFSMARTAGTSVRNRQAVPNKFGTGLVSNDRKTVVDPSCRPEPFARDCVLAGALTIVRSRRRIPRSASARPQIRLFFNLRATDRRLR